MTALFSLLFMVISLKLLLFSAVVIAPKQLHVLLLPFVSNICQEKFQALLSEAIGPKGIKQERLVATKVQSW